jgi:multicomponent Na+:H+ antiporter subunit C
MSAAILAGLTAAALVGFGLYGLLTDPHPLRKILAFNILGSGVFLMFGIAVALLLRLFQETGRTTLNPDGPAKTPDSGADS